MPDILNYEIPLWAIAAYWVFMAIVSNMPTPREGERWYSFLFGLLHTLAANIERARVGIAKAKNGTSTGIFPPNVPPKQ